jgi:hypothetical protein
MMLSRLRKIEALTIKIAEEMPIHINIETDTLYLRGTAKGIEQGIEQERSKNVINLWLNGIELSMITNLLNLPIEQVEAIIAKFEKNNKV